MTSQAPDHLSQWIFTRQALLATPSRATSSISLDKELYDRARGVEFLFRLGSSLQLPTTALTTAATWFHRFYMRFSLEDYHRQDVAAACVFLATKTEECGRKLRDIAKVCQSKVNGVPIDQVTKEDLETAQNTILVTEEVLLEALCFDFVVDNPHEVLVDLFQQGDNSSTEELAWSIAHDSYRTVLCLLFNIRIIAAACYVLSQRVIEGSHSASLDARISSSSPSASLPTPPSHKPTSPDATRFAIEYFCFTDQELSDLADALAILIEFYAAQDTQGALSFVTPISTIPPPTSSLKNPKLYSPLSHVSPTNANSQSRPPTADIHERTPESSHGGNSPTKTPSHSWLPVKGEAGGRALGNPVQGRLDLS